MVVLKYYQYPGLTETELKRIYKKIEKVLKEYNSKNAINDLKISSETCYYVEVQGNDLNIENEKKLLWLLSCPFKPTNTRRKTFLEESQGQIIEIGPRLNSSTAFSTNSISICESMNLSQVSRIEHSTRFNIKISSLDQPQHPTSLVGPQKIPKQLKDFLILALHDKMTQMEYMEPLESLTLHLPPEPVFEVDLIEGGRELLETSSKELGLSFDVWDLNFYADLFVNKLKRNPTSVECFDLAQSNSEHCRHWFFKGKFFIDDQPQPLSLLQMVIDTQKTTNQNNVIKFSDNSSAIEGYKVSLLTPKIHHSPSHFLLQPPSLNHIVFTAETHNFPTGVAPFQGATTGTGGRIRDVQATGRGARVVAGTVGYCVGALNIPDYPLFWENSSLKYPKNLASPLEIIIEGSNGASDYGNKFGEPVVSGFFRSFGLEGVGGERREWIKPIMFTGGIGSIEDRHVIKISPEKGMKVVKLGGPVLRIGLGGGCASSIQVQDHVEIKREDLDFNAVQRGDPEMEQKMNRVIRACSELSTSNPICSIHDQGAGGNGNVLKELCHPGGAEITLSSFHLGDPSLSALEVWTAEYQESNALLVKEEDLEGLKKISSRERCPLSVVGHISGDNKMTFVDDRTHLNFNSSTASFSPLSKKHKNHLPTSLPALNLDLDLILGDVPRKEYHVKRLIPQHTPLSFPPSLSALDALQKVLRLPSVASKRFLTNKVDRSVTGLVAQQQCVGPLHTPLADVAVVALTPFQKEGAATAIGEQPIKMLVDVERGARMAVVESLTNLVFSYVGGDIKNIKCSANWMWPAKLEGEDAKIYDACVAMTTLMSELGLGVDGGKDSLSMACKVEGTVIKSPGNLVISTYSACPDITLTITPDLKCPQGKGNLLYIPLNCGKYRLGGSAFSQCFKSLGESCPDLEDVQLFIRTFACLQDLIKDDKICSGHDVSDGGMVVCLLEMAFAGNCGIQVSVANGDSQISMMEFLFSEEVGFIIEVSPLDFDCVTWVFHQRQIPFFNIGSSSLSSDKLFITYNGKEIIGMETSELRDVWEETSFRLERLQTGVACVLEEQELLRKRKRPQFKVTFDTEEPLRYLSYYGVSPLSSSYNPSHSTSVCLLREEGSNGDREMAAALFMAGFCVVDVNMQDLQNKSINLDQFRGLVFVGGFSYADVCGSAKGWATSIKFNEVMERELGRFLQRGDTFSLGVCNGCQLMAYLGWVGTDVDNKENDIGQGVMLERNLSERYESRFVNVRIEESPSLMLRGMQGSVLGVWVAHGEGRFVFRNEIIRQIIKSSNLISLVYADDSGSPTQAYPLNPNGSSDAIAGLCSHDGRHLAMMPHPERTVFKWQWPWLPLETKWKTSPWVKMFVNAYKWCLELREED